MNLKSPLTVFNVNVPHSARIDKNGTFKSKSKHLPIDKFGRRKGSNISIDQ